MKLSTATNFKPINLMAILICIFIPTFYALCQEISISFDSTNRFFVVNEKLNRELSFLTTYDKLIEAKLFQISDTSFAFEIYYYKDKKILKDRIILSQKDFGGLRAKFDSLISFHKYQLDGLNQEGRIRLIVTSSCLSLGFYGWAIPQILESKNPMAFYTTVGALGIIAPYFLTSNKSVQRADAMLFYYGGTRGIAHGYFLSDIIKIFGNNDRNHLAFSFLFSLGEAIGGYNLAKKLQFSDGTAGSIQVFADFGLLLGLGTSKVLALNTKNSSAIPLLSSLGGSILGYYTAENKNYTYGNGFVFETSGYLGAYTGFSIANLLNIKNDKTIISYVMLSGIASAALTHLMLLKDIHFTTAQGIFSQLGTTGFTLLGAGLGLSISHGREDKGKVVTTLSALTGLVGFAAFYYYFSQEQMPIKPKFSIQFSPQSSLFLLSRNKVIDKNFYSPILSISFKY
ncbi:MAG: hypothetical protein ACPLRO_02455 [Candidatus Kapaibacteriota bacterium]